MASAFSCPRRRHGRDPWRNSFCRARILNGEKRLARIASRIEIVLSEWLDSETGLPSAQGELNAARGSKPLLTCWCVLVG